jgi:hypothetical protein
MADKKLSIAALSGSITAITGLTLNLIHNLSALMTRQAFVSKN